MKTISIIAFSISLAILALVVSQQRAAEKDYLKKETFVKQLNKDTFFTKLRKLPPQWMEEQISEDFQEFTSITKAKVDATFSKFEYIPNSYIVRYRIYNRELYRFLPAGELISSVDNSTEQALKTLIRLLPLPDMDFIFSYFDGIPLPPGLPNEYIFASSKELQAPVFFSAKLKNTQSVVLIPDARSIGNWWISDIKTIKSKMAKIPWEEKKNFALWRGSLTRPNRLKLCELSKLYPNYLDAKLSDKVNDDTRQKELEDAGLFGGKVSWEEFLSCKYLPTMDGVMCAAPALQWRLLSNSVTFKPETNEIQWFYRALKPYIHYIPLKEDLSDLIEKLEWAKSHDSQCKQIADQATQFALNNLMYEDVLLYLSLVLDRYASLQELNSNEIAKDLQEDPRWVKIQYRKEIKTKCNNYTMNPTPY